MVALFTPVASWMYFRRLDGLRDADGVYTLAWRLTDKPGDPWTSRIDRFKFQSSAGTLKGAQAVLEMALPALLDESGWQPPTTAITSALSAVDTKIIPTKPLPTVASRVAETLGLRWLPSLLTKQPHQRLHTLHSAGERQQELDKAKYASASVSGGTQRILVLDDMVTRGETLARIASAIRRASPTVSVVGIALGKSERQGYAASQGHDISNDHVPRAWGKAWDGQ